MQKPVCLADFEVHFNHSLNKNALGYYSTGANQEQTLKDNVEAFMRYVCTYVYTVNTCDYKSYHEPQLWFIIGKFLIESTQN